jgi:cytochrome c oxidase assembly protein subunit 15
MTSNSHVRWFRRIALIAAALAFGVVVLGAYVRLSDAGLGCPDWPTCYGHWTAGAAAAHADQVSGMYPSRPVDYARAIREMVHRYFAAGLGALITLLALIAVANQRHRTLPVALPVFLFLFVILQGVFGALTVTWQLQPIIVTAHLLGGMTTLALLVWLNLKPEVRAQAPAERGLWRWALVALAALGLQLALGGWVSSNYAAVACPDFPTCQQRWLPSMDFADAFVLWRGLGVDYTGGILDHPARVAIHFVHRLGAVVAGLALVIVALGALARAASGRLRLAAFGVIAAVALQITIAIAMVLMMFPLWLATLHNAGAAILVIAAVALLRYLKPLSPTYLAGERRF